MGGVVPCSAGLSSSQTKSYDKSRGAMLNKSAVFDIKCCHLRNNDCKSLKRKTEAEENIDIIDICTGDCWVT
jgi:hypothetical protein